MLETKTRFKLDAIIEDDFNIFPVFTSEEQEVPLEQPAEHVKMENCSKEMIERIKERVKRI